MASTYRQPTYPEPPRNLPPEVRAYLEQLVRVMGQSETALVRALEDQEPVASLKVLGEAPVRSKDGDEVEVDATLGAVAPFGSGAGKYVRRLGLWVFGF